MSTTTDDLARKLYEAHSDAPADAWERVHPVTRARWEQVAAVARAVVARTQLSGLEFLIKATEGDPEAAPYLPGLRFLAEGKRRALENPMTLEDWIESGDQVRR